MIDADQQRLREVWDQKAVPIILRRGSGRPLRVKFPYREDGRVWLRQNRHSIPRFNRDAKAWEVPQAWLSHLIDQMLKTYGAVYVIQPYREQEKCAPACWNAEGDECQCSCMGANHGMQSPSGSWKIVSDAFATRWGAEELACRLIKRQR